MPLSPAKVSFRPPRATPSRAISVMPRVMSRALVLSPSPMPSLTPQQRASTFFSAAPSSTPSTSLLVYTRNLGLMNTSCTSSAAAISLEAATQPVGALRPTSSAWEGPERAATRPLPPSSSSMTWVMHRAVSRSTPLAADTTTASSRSSGAAILAVSRTAKDGVAITTAPLSRRLSSAALRCSASGSGTPGSLGFSRACSSSALRRAEWDHSVTSCPLSVSSSARAVPQPPLPSTVIFIPAASYACFLCRENLLSVPLSSRLMLARCCHTINPPMIKASTTICQ